MKIASRATPEGLAGHGLSTTALKKTRNCRYEPVVTKLVCIPPVIRQGLRGSGST